MDEQLCRLTLWSMNGHSLSIGPKGLLTLGPWGPHEISFGRTARGRLGLMVTVLENDLETYTKKGAGYKRSRTPKGTQAVASLVLTREQVKALADHLAYQMPRLTLAAARATAAQERRCRTAWRSQVAWEKRGRVSPVWKTHLKICPTCAAEQEFA